MKVGVDLVYQAHGLLLEDRVGTIGRHAEPEYQLADDHEYAADAVAQKVDGQLGTRRRGEDNVETVIDPGEAIGNKQSIDRCNDILPRWPELAPIRFGLHSKEILVHEPLLDLPIYDAALRRRLREGVLQSMACQRFDVGPLDGPFRKKPHG